jgi:hypothetical protein
MSMEQRSNAKSNSRPEIGGVPEGRGGKAPVMLIGLLIICALPLQRNSGRPADVEAHVGIGRVSNASCRRVQSAIQER